MAEAVARHGSGNAVRAEPVGEEAAATDTGAERVAHDAAGTTAHAEPMPHDAAGTTAAGAGTGYTAQGGPGRNEARAHGPFARRARRGRMLLLAAAIVVGMFGLAWSMAQREPARERVVVAPFENRTGDAALDAVGAMAADWVTQGLARTELVEVVPISSAVAAARAAGTLTDAPSVQALSRETGARYVVTGTIYRVGDALQIQTRVMSSDGVVLRALDAATAPRDAPLEAIERVRQHVLAALAPMVDRRISSYAQTASRPPSYEAYREYALGIERMIARDWEGAIVRFRGASASDPSYTLPLVMTGIAHFNLTQYAAADSVARIAVRSRDALPPLDRAALDNLTAWLRGDNAAAYQAARRAAELGPTSLASGQVAAEALRLNRPREAVRVLTRLDPGKGEMRGNVFYWSDLADAHHQLRKYRNELRAARRARELLPDEPLVRLIEMRALVALRQLDRIPTLVDQLIATAGDAQPNAGAALRDLALELYAHGHESAGADVRARALAWYASEAAAGRASRGQRLTLAMLLHEAGRLNDAHHQVQEMLAADSASIAVRALAGLVAAERGDTASAARAARWLEDLRRPYLWGRDYYWRAVIAAALNDTEQAVQLLESAFAHGLGYGPFLHNDARLDPLRAEPGFRAFLRPRG